MTRVRADIVDLYVLRPRAGAGAAAIVGAGYEALQLRRARQPLLGTWQPVMGHIEPGETAVAAAAREAREEVALDLTDRATVQGFWQLEQVHPFFIAASDEIVLSPRFLALVSRDWTPRLNDEHDAWRWTGLDNAPRAFSWPGQLASLREAEALLAPGSLQGHHLRLELQSGKA